MFLEFDQHDKICGSSELIFCVAFVTGLAVGVPVRYFLLGDSQEAQQQLTLAKERPEFFHGDDCSFNAEVTNGGVEKWWSEVILGGSDGQLAQYYC